MKEYGRFDDEEYADEYLMDDVMLKKLKEDSQYRVFFQKAKIL